MTRYNERKAGFSGGCMVKKPTDNRMHTQPMPLRLPNVSRRRFVLGAAGASLLASLPLHRAAAGLPQARPVLGNADVLRGTVFDLDVGYRAVNFTGRERVATMINQRLPAPVLRWREGDRVTLRVTNHLAHDTSIHWHGIILPTDMDGVPGLSFDGIAPGETFTYEFDVKQSGTYWYHSHSGFQEQTGMYGALVIDPRGPDAVGADRDYVVLLSDWSDETPQEIFAKLKKESHYYNRRRRTVGDLLSDIRRQGVARTWDERAMWNRMRMSNTDLSDVTAFTYTYLMNGVPPDAGWRALFNAGEKVRLRFINGSAMTIFDVRIPGLKMTVVAADGQNIDPVTIDEFRLGVAETYDVLVEPRGDSAYTIFAQSIGRTGYARGTLTPDADLLAPVPALDPAPFLTHRDMGMGHDMHAMHGMPEQRRHDQHQHQHHHHHHHAKAQPAGAVRKRLETGPQIDMLAENPQSGLHDPGVGLRDHERLFGRKVLTYADIRNLYPTIDQRDPGREIELHLTGNMRRYMWSFDGVPFADAEPLHLKYGERVRITLVNDTMMTHPIHLHGMWSELDIGDAPDGRPHLPRKHTVIVQPGSKISYMVTADARGRWAYHCHLIYHMAGMMREVRVA